MAVASREIQEEKGTKEKIFNTAARLFAEKGYNGVSMREISEETGLSKPTIYYYFGSKEGIYKELIHAGLSNGTKEFEDIIKKNISIKQKLIEIVKSNGGQVSYKRNPDGTDSPYELNITYVDAILADKSSSRADKFLASQSIQYALPGVPAAYIHSLLGSRNWVEGVKQTGRARTINREKLHLEKLVSELKNPDSFRARVFFPYLDLIRTRKKQRAFHPNAGFEVLQIDPKIFGIKRSSPDQQIVALTNISSESVSISLPAGAESGPMMDLMTGEDIDTRAIQLNPYQYLWLEEKR